MNRGVDGVGAAEGQVFAHALLHVGQELLLAAIRERGEMKTVKVKKNRTG